MRLEVWAPFAGEVEAVVNGSDRVSLSQSADGWWRSAAHYPAGTRYVFHLDGGNALPDPRSMYQPEGVNGPSEVVETAKFSWSDGGWQPPPLAGALIYELHIGTFTEEGTLTAAISKLSYLKDLGVTHVELMPVAEFPGERGWGYDGVDLFAVHHKYGGPEALKLFVEACHAEGLAVLLDVVYNHLGPSGNYLRAFGPYFTDRFHTPWGEAVNFDDAYSDQVRRFFIDNALMWLREYHIDGLRLDAVHAMFDMSAKHFLAQLAEEVELLSAALGRHLVLIAESDLNDPRVITPREANGYGIDTQWTDDFHHALHTVLTGECDGYYCDFGSFAQLAEAMCHGYVYRGAYSKARGRSHGAAPVRLAGSRFVVCLQNHDQIGNRADGSRTSHLLSHERLKIGAAVLLFSPYVPMLFQGEEWGATSPFLYFTDHQEPELAEAVRQGRRHEFSAFGWKPEDVPDPQANATFDRSKLNWSELEGEPHQELLEWYRALIRLRRSEPTLSNANRDAVEVRYSEHSKWLYVRRGTIALLVNLGNTSLQFPSQDSEPAAIAEIILASTTIEIDGDALRLPPDSVALIRLLSDVQAHSAAADSSVERTDRARSA